MKRLFLAAILALGAFTPGCSTVQPPPTTVPVRDRGIAITFPREPSSATQDMLRAAGAIPTRKPLVWSLDAYNWRDGIQAQAIHAALAEGAHLGPR